MTCISFGTVANANMPEFCKKVHIACANVTKITLLFRTRVVIENIVVEYKVISQ